MASSDGMSVNIGLEMTRPSLRCCNAIDIEILNNNTKNPPGAQGPRRDAIDSPLPMQVGALQLEPPCSVIWFVNFTHFFGWLSVASSCMYMSLFPSVIPQRCFQSHFAQRSVAS